MAFLKPLARVWSSGGLKGLPAIWLVISSLLLMGRLELPAQTAASKEYQIKAAFLYNFTQFVSWPPEAFSEPQSPLVIGILGDDPFGSFLDEMVSGEKVNNRPLVVKRYRSVEDIKGCHVL